MDEARAVEQHVEGADLLRQRLDLGSIGDVETACRDPGRLGELGKLADIDVGRDDLGPFGSEGQSGGTPDSRTRA